MRDLTAVRRVVNHSKKNKLEIDTNSHIREKSHFPVLRVANRLIGKEIFQYIVVIIDVRSHNLYQNHDCINT